LSISEVFQFFPYLGRFVMLLLILIALVVLDKSLSIYYPVDKHEINPNFKNQNFYSEIINKSFSNSNFLGLENKEKGFEACTTIHTIPP
jgi:uncharacterized membrane protein SpoIIM required for sporulation